MSRMQKSMGLRKLLSSYLKKNPEEALDKIAFCLTSVLASLEADGEEGRESRDTVLIPQSWDQQVRKAASSLFYCLGKTCRFQHWAWASNARGIRQRNKQNTGSNSQLLLGVRPAGGPDSHQLQTWTGKTEKQRQGLKMVVEIARPECPALAGGVAAVGAHHPPAAGCGSHGGSRATGTLSDHTPQQPSSSTGESATKHKAGGRRSRSFLLQLSGVLGGTPQADIEKEPAGNGKTEFCRIQVLHHKVGSRRGYFQQRSDK